MRSHYLQLLGFLLLVAGSCFLRSFRFERDDGQPIVRLADLRSAEGKLPEGVSWAAGPQLRVSKKQGRSNSGLEFILPYSAPLEALHIRVKVRASKLLRGEHLWEEGRVLIRWENSECEAEPKFDPIGAAEDEEIEIVRSIVVKPASGRAYPILLIENLAASGDLLISDLELTPVKQRSGWFFESWILILFWFSWIFVCLSGKPSPTASRKAAAAALWIAMGIAFAFPGPWQRLSPLVVPYHFGGEEISSSKVIDVPLGAEEAAEVPVRLTSYEPMGEIHTHENWIVKTRQFLKKIRLLLHVGFIFLVATGFFLLIDMKRAIWLAAGLVVAIEGSQWGFGYGFDIKDVIDLFSGGIGILLARPFCRRLPQWFPRSKGMVFPPS